MLVLPAKRRFLVFGVICLAGFVNRAWTKTSATSPHVDERVELLSVVFRLAGNGEYNMNKLPAYSADIDHFFASFKEHPAVQMARAVAERDGVGFDAAMSMAISLSQPPELKPLVPFTATVPDRRWTLADVETFLPLLREFYRESKFADFYAAHRAMYRLAEERFAMSLNSIDLGWYPRFYGQSPGLIYRLVLALNNGGGNYGPRVIYPNARVELFSIIGCWTHDDAGNPTFPLDKGYLSTIIHEYNHSFVNPAVDEHWKEFSGLEHIYSTVADQMQRMAYGDSKAMVYESLVRAAVILYFQQAGEDARTNLKRIREEQRDGFLWMDRLVDKLKLYQNQRTQYPTFSSYLPQIALFYRDLPQHLAADAADFDRKSAHVVRMEPFANHAQEVDPSIRTMTIFVDKPLDPSGYSISAGMDGIEHDPISGKPIFGGDGRHIQLRLQLKPNEEYSFVLTPNAFATPDGYPLVTYKVEFKTK